MSNPAAPVDGSPHAPSPTRNGPVLACVLMAMFLAAMDSTVVVTLLPAIIDEMRIEAWYPWLFSGFILEAAIVTPLVGRLADVLGAKKTILISLAVFLATSALAAAAPNGLVLTIARILQGGGAGALIAMSYVLAGAMFTDEKRARLQSMLTAVWGVSAIGGPVIGTLFTETVGWRWVFWLNVPLSLAAIAVIAVGFRGEARPEEKTEKLLDWPALGLFALALTALLLLLLSPNLSLGGPWLVVLAVAFVVGLLAQLVYLRRHPERSVIPLGLVRPGPVRRAALVTLTTSLAMHGSLTILPLAADKLGVGPVSGAVTVMVGAAGLVVGSAACAPLMKSHGYRGTALLGGQAMLLGSAMLVLASAGLAPAVVFAAGEGVVGVATGLLLGMTMVFIQDATPKATLGSYTSAVSLLRNVGGAIGINLLASVQLFAAERGPAGDTLPWSFGVAFAVQVVVVAFGLLMAYRIPRDLPAT